MMMNSTREAFDQIDEIHRQLARSSIYRGYRSFYVALSGILGLAAGLASPAFVETVPSRVFVGYWVVVSGINLSLCAALMGYRYVVMKSRWERKKTVQVLNQFVPMLVAGLMVTLSLFYIGEHTLALLPGIWALLFGMGLFSLRPYLPDRIMACALYYFAAAGVLFWMAYSAPRLLSLGMGITFGAGQLLSAAVLYWSIEKNDQEPQE